LYRNEGIIFGNLNVPTSCRHCENPLCLTDCPPGDAIQRDPRGEVYINEEKCIGCGNCAANCPYSVIFMLHAKPKVGAMGRLLNLIGLAQEQAIAEDSPTKAVKCDLCRNDAAGPACVRSCPTGAAVRVTPAEYFEKVGAALR
jgi:Fe-S-cluster-containing hydrogenase component 2